MTDARQRRMLCADKYQICVPCVIFGQSPVFYIARVDDINEHLDYPVSMSATNPASRSK